MQNKKVDVARDNSCLFWSVALAYLIPVRDDDTLFQQRYETLFGDEEAVIQNLNHIRDLFRNLGTADYDDALANLVRNIFRNRVVNYMSSHESEFRNAAVSESGGSFERYLEDMRKPDTWGGEPEIKAISEMLSARIGVSGAVKTQYGNGNIQIQLFHVAIQDVRNHYNFSLEQHIVDDTELRGLKRLAGRRVIRIKGSFAEGCFKTAIELGYKDVVQARLSSDVYHYIRLMKSEKFQEEERFSEALNMVEEAVAEVMSSWVNCKQDLLKEVECLLKEGIEVDIDKMGRKDLIDELESRQIELSRDDRKKERLVKILKEEGGGKVRLGKTVVGALISTLFFNHQSELMKDKESFKLGISGTDKSRREKEINELNEKIDSKSFVKEKVLEKIKLLNSSSHVFNNWFFREVLEKIVNDKEKLGKLKAVCAAICKEKVEKLLNGTKVHKDAVDILGFFGVEVPRSQIITLEIPKSSAIMDDHFKEDIQKPAEEIRKEGEIQIEEETGELSDIPAFAGLKRRVTIDLKNKRSREGLTDDEARYLKERVLKIMSEIKEGINMLVRGNSEYCMDTEDIFEHFKIINSEIKKKDKREIVELVCRKGNVKLLEMISKQENKDGGGRVRINAQYPWKGEFTGYGIPIELLQYVLKQQCSSEIVLYIAKKVYGCSQDYSGLDTAIGLALDSQNIDWSMVRLLIEAGANINTINRSGETVLSLILNFQHGDSTSHEILQNQLSILFSYVVNAENEEQEEIFNMIRSLGELLHKQNINISPLFFEGLKKARDADHEELPNKNGPTQRILAIAKRISDIEADIVYPFNQQQEPDVRASYAQPSQRQEPNSQSANDSSVPLGRLSSLGGSNNDQPVPSSKLDEVPLRSQSLSSLYSNGVA